MPILNAKLYTDRIPKQVSTAMTSIANDHCYLIKRQANGNFVSGKAANCHRNVSNAAAAHGGEMVNGWLLFRIRKLTDVGVYVWAFHSVWRTSSGEIIDITDDKNYIDSEFSTFWYDPVRKVDLNEGITYNNLLIFASDEIANHYSRAVGDHLVSGVPFWTTHDMKLVRRMNEHSGEYRLITPDYPNNISRLEEQYGVKIVNGKLTKNGSSDQLHSNSVFDYSLSIR